MVGEFDFNKDLLKGEDAEEIILALLQKKYPFTHKIQGYFKGYDIIVPEIDTTIEVKRDMLACKTGNYFIETKSGGLPSGITTSTSDIWAIVDGKSIILIKTDKLRTLIKNLEEKTYPAKGRDKERSGKLITRDTLLKYAKKI